MRFLPLPVYISYFAQSFRISNRLSIFPNKRVVIQMLEVYANFRLLFIDVRVVCLSVCLSVCMNIVYVSLTSVRYYYYHIYVMASFRYFSFYFIFTFYSVYLVSYGMRVWFPPYIYFLIHRWAALGCSAIPRQPVVRVR